MAVLVASGFENNGFDDFSLLGSGTIVATSKINGTYCVYINNAIVDSYIHADLGGSKDVTYTHFQFQWDYIVGSETDIYLAAQLGDSTKDVSWRVFKDADRKIVIQLYTGAERAGEEEAIGSTVLTKGVNYRIEVYFNRTGGAGGKAYLEVKLNGSTEVSLTHSASAGVAYSNIGFGNMDEINTASQFTYFDDCWVNDDAGSKNTGWPGNLTFVYLRPNADGTYDDWFGNPDDTDHYANVDEVSPDDETSYNRNTITLDTRFSSEVNSIASGKTIRVVKPILVAKQTASSVSGSKTLLRDDTTDGKASITLTAAYKAFGAYYEVRVAGGGDWTNATVSALEVGAEVGGGTGFAWPRDPTGDTARKDLYGVPDDTDHYLNVDEGTPGDDDSTYITTAIGVAVRRRWHGGMF